MKILIGHNYYQHSGGEDVVFKSEVELLRRNGHDVLVVEMTNKDFLRLSSWEKIQHVLSWHWSSPSYQFIKEKCASFAPDIAHFHNTFYMMTPSVYAACKDMNVPVVQTLHNFRLLCCNGLLFRNGAPCEACLDKSLNQGILHACYHHSRILSWAVVRMLKKYWRQKTWDHHINAFIVLSDFARRKFLGKGIDERKFKVKSNFIATDPMPRVGSGSCFVYAGRLSPEKGIFCLLDAFAQLPHQQLIVMGDGELRRDVEAYIKEKALVNVSMAGFLNRDEYFSTLKKARALILPSLCYENFPVSIIEAFACAVPVIVSRLGSMKEIVEENKTGLLFSPGDAQALAAAIQQIAGNDEMAIEFGKNGRMEYLRKYTDEANYKMLISIYTGVINAKAGM